MTVLSDLLARYRNAPAPSIGKRGLLSKELNFTYPQRDVTADPAVVLGTTKPATPTLSITIAEADLPTADYPCSFLYSAALWALFRNVTAGAVKLHFGVYFNDTFIIDYESGWGNLAANTNVMHSLFSYSLKNVVVGDKIDLFAWAGAADSIQYQRHLFMVTPTELQLGDALDIFYEVELTNARFPSGTGLTYSQVSSDTQVCYLTHNYGVLYKLPAVGVAKVMGLQQRKYGMLYGAFSYNTTSEDSAAHATNVTVKSGYYPTKITWKEPV